MAVVTAFGLFTAPLLRLCSTFDDPLKALLGDVLLRLFPAFTIASEMESTTFFPWCTPHDEEKADASRLFLFQLTLKASPASLRRADRRRGRAHRAR